MTITIKNSSRSHPVVLINTDDERACRGIAVCDGWQCPFGPFAQTAPVSCINLAEPGVPGHGTEGHLGSGQTFGSSADSRFFDAFICVEDKIIMVRQRPRVDAQAVLSIGMGQHGTWAATFTLE